MIKIISNELGYIHYIVLMLAQRCSLKSKQVCSIGIDRVVSFGACIKRYFVALRFSCVWKKMFSYYIYIYGIT